jgi:thioredoxin reductase (NADPH)
MDEQIPYDVAIIGGGPAGITAAIYSARGGMKTIVMEMLTPGGQIATIDLIENFPGLQSIEGHELARRMKEQAHHFGADFLHEKVKGIGVFSPSIEELNFHRNEKLDMIFQIMAETKIIYALSVIIATGTQWRRLGVPGEEALRGKGVSYCATCDGPFFRDQEIVVVGGGNTAIQEAIFLTGFAKKVKLIHRRDRLRADKILQERAFSNQKIEFIWDSVIEEIHGDEGVKGVSILNLKSGKREIIPCEGVFVFIGLAPNTEFLNGFIDLDDMGFILTDEDMKTSHKGVFACGDCRKKALRQIITACGDGAVAAHSAREYVEEIKGISYSRSFQGK